MVAKMERLPNRTNILLVKEFFGLTRERAGELGTPRIGAASIEENFKLMPISRFLWEQRRDARVALPLVVARIALRVGGPNSNCIE